MAFPLLQQDFGLLIVDPEHPSLDWLSESSLDHLQAASVAYRIAIGPHAERKARTLYSVPRRAPGRVDADKPPAPMTWAQRLKRVFHIDIETCPECGGKLRVIACIEDPPLIAKILDHVRRREALFDSSPRAPPDSLPLLNLT